MHPILFKVGTFEARTFGLLMVIAVVAGVILAVRRAPRFGLNRDQILDMAVWAVIPGIIGARLAYILMNWKDEFAGHPERLLTLKFEGLTSFGALILGGVGVFLFAKYRKISVRDLLDTMATPMLLGWGIGRIGCLLNGCCYGRVCESGFCVDFGHYGSHQPAQLVETVIMLLGVFALSALEKAQTYRRPGTSFALSLIVFNVSRFIYEFFRGGTPEEYRAGIVSGRYLSWAPITEAQLTSILFIVVVSTWWFWNRRRRQSEPISA
ncbi:MAG: prolipoprotein diacylglyceryl transferase [Fimbriimonadaceae bacterium]|nr:prolipoprotein diacylglyceryl transferase [Fimbriimonadaceae bacterium]